MMRRLVGLDGKPIKLATYEGAKVFFNDTAKSSDLSNEGRAVGEETSVTRDLLAKVLDLAVINPISAGSTEAEELRLRRAEALMAYASLPGPRRGVSEDDQLPLLKEWANKERSVQVRKIVESAMRVFRTHEVGQTIT